MMHTGDLTISAVIIARNEQATIQRCIESVLAQSVRIDEIIVIDGNSTDRTQRVVEELSRRRDRIRLVIEDVAAPEKGPAAARNFGASLASGDLLLFMNGDVSVGADYVSKLLTEMEKSELDAVAGLRWNVRNSLVSGLMNVHYALNYNTSSGTLENPAFLSGDAMLIRAGAFWSIGGYDPTMPAGEDADLGYRLRGDGRKIGYCPEATVWHEGRHYRTVGEWVKQIAWYGRGAAALARAHDWRLAKERSGLQSNVIAPLSGLLAFLLVLVVAAAVAGPALLAVAVLGTVGLTAKYVRMTRTVRSKCASASLPTRPLEIDVILYPLFRFTRYGLLSVFTWQALLTVNVGEDRRHAGNGTL